MKYILLCCLQVAPAELEALLLQHNGVAEAGVVGLPDEMAGELPIAFIVRQPNADVTEKELVEFIASKVGTRERRTTSTRNKALKCEL